MDRKVLMGFFFINFVLMDMFCVVLMKLVLWLDLNCIIGFLMVMKCFKVLINVVLDNFFMIFICIVLVIIYVNNKVYCFWLVELFLVFLWIMVYGLNVFMLIYENGG